jgi:lysophospholipase L1-like esterase
MAPAATGMQDWIRLTSWILMPCLPWGAGLEGRLAWNPGIVLDTVSRSLHSSSAHLQAMAVQPVQAEWDAIVNTVDLQQFLPPPVSIDPNFPSFNSQRLDQQLKLYANYLSRVGTPDVLIVGSSRSLQGIDPLVLQEALNAQGYAGLNIYNFSINGATAQVIDLVLRRILTPEQLPQLILWGDGSRAFNSGRVDRTYNSIVASEGFKRLEIGDRPIQSGFRPTPERLPAFLPELCMDWQEPSAAIAPSSSVCSALEETASIPDAAASNPLPQPEVIAPDLNANGFQAVSTQFNPATYYRQFPRVSGRYDSNYVPFQLNGEQTAATVAIARFARAHRVPLVFVNLPLSGEYLDTVRNRYERQFRQHMQQLASREGFLFRDLLNRWPTQHDYYADPSHLNQNGARAVALQLVADPNIPWPQPRSVTNEGSHRE